MAEHNYKLTGSGRTVREADRSLGQQRRDLMAKMKSRGANQEFNVASTEYHAAYTLKPGRKAGEHPSMFKQDSPDGWAALRTNAAKVVPLGNYGVSYAVDQFLNLTAEQIAATQAKQSPAGRPYERPSALDRLEEVR